MKIKQTLFTAGYSSSYFDDQQAIKNGAGHDGFIYTSDPVTPGFTSVRQADECASVQLIPENGVIAVGGYTAMQYSGAGGRDPLFLAGSFIPFLNDHIKPLLEGRDVDLFLPNARFFNQLRIDGHLLRTAVRYGPSQALLDTAALATGCLKTEVVYDEWQLPCVPEVTPLLGQSGDNRYIAVDKMILKGVDVLPHALINNVEEKPGSKGERLREYIRWLSNRILSLHAGERCHPILHIDVYGTIGLIFDMDPVRCTEYIASLGAEVQGLSLYIEGPVDAGNKLDQIRMLVAITRELARLGSGVKIVADKWCNTHQDIMDFTDAGSCRVVQIRTPGLGGTHSVVDVVLYCNRHTIEAYRGGTCSGTEISTRTCIHVALAVRPIRMLVKPGMGFDEGLNIMLNEMNRTTALLQTKDWEMARTFKVLSPTVILGYDFPEESFRKAMEESPDLIAVDAGSSDPGPHYLGVGRPFTDGAGMKRDLRYMIVIDVKNNIPIIIGTAGDSSTAPHLKWCYQIIHEITRGEELSSSMALTPSDVNREIAHQALGNGKITALDFVPGLTHEAIGGSTYIVTQMGIEPFQRALRVGAQVVLGRHTYGPVCFTVLPIMQGSGEGLTLHCNKIFKCAAIAATSGPGSDCAMGIVGDDGFALKAFNPKRKFTETSAVAHTLYKESDLYFPSGSGNVLNPKVYTFTQVDKGEAYVSGPRHEGTPYALKLEGAHQVGFHCLTIAGTRDPIMIAGIDMILEEVQASVARNLSLNDSSIRVTFHLYGKNGVMGNHGPMKTAGHELGTLLDIAASTQDIANSVCSLIRSTLLYYGYESRVMTADNLAFLFSPSGIQSGPVHRFSIYHLIEASDALRFDFHIEQVTSKGVQA